MANAAHFELRRVVVLGAGAVGCSIAALLHEREVDVALLARGEHARAMREHGLRLVLPEGERTVRAPVFESVHDIEFTPGDLALLSTKLNDAETLLDGLREHAGPDVPLVCAVNGMEGERWACERFSHVVAMMVWLPATFLVPGEVRLHTSAACRGVLDVGGLQPEAAPHARALAARLVDAGFDSIVRGDIARWKAAKWITNLGGTAQALVAAATEEQRALDVRRVSEAAQFEGQVVLDGAGVERIPHAKFLERVEHVGLAPIAGLARQGGSTWQSRQRGRPLETPWIEGALAELAERHGIPAPVNAALAQAAREGRTLSADEALGCDGLEPNTAC